MLVAWIAGVAPVTLSYLGEKSWQEVSDAFGGGAGRGATNFLQPPLVEYLTIGASAVAFGVLVVVGALSLPIAVVPALPRRFSQRSVFSTFQWWD